MFALFTLAGVAFTLDFASAAAVPGRMQTLVSAVALAAVWILGYRRGDFPAFAAPLEGVLLAALTMDLPEPLASIGIYFIGTQFRALFGTRRDAWVLAFSFGLAFVIGVALSPVGVGVVTPVVLVEILALGFCAYVLHTLAEALERDRQRTIELRNSENRYRVMFDNNPWPMWVTDPRDNRLIDANKAAVLRYGFTREEFLAMTIRDLRAPDDLRAFERQRRDIEGDQRFTYPARHRRRDGGIIDVEMTLDTVEFAGRRARIALGVDVTEREAAARALRESEQRFRSVVENLREAVMIADTDDRIVLANSRVRDVLGYERAEVIGRRASELLLPPTNRNLFHDKLGKRLSGETELYEAELVRKDGTHVFAEVSASPYRDASGKIIGSLGAISDVTDRRRLEDRLRQAQRMEAVGQLAGGVAHDFNNLLTVIKCNTELLLEDATQSDGWAEIMRDVARAADRGASLTRQLLAFSRKQLLQPRTVPLTEIIAQAAPGLRRTIGDRVRLSVRNGYIGSVHADPSQIESVLEALARNASDAMPRGGDIVITTSLAEQSEADTAPPVPDMPDGPFAIITISDTGSGMDKATLGRLFEPFFTTKEPGQGSGLGLASVYGIVRQSGGFIDVASAPGRGTTFRIFLPIVPAAHTDTRVLQPR